MNSFNNTDDGRSPNQRVDSFTKAPLTERRTAPENHYGDSSNYRPNSTTGQDDEQYNYFSTAYQGPRVSLIRNQKPSLGPKVYRPHESTAFKGPRGGFLYAGKPLFEDVVDISAQEAGFDPTYHLRFIPEKLGLVGFVRRKKIPLLIGGGIAATIALILAAGYVVLFPAKDLGPQEAISKYFTAIMDNDPLTALSLGAQYPENQTFLTENALKRQNDAATIKELTFLDTQEDSNRATVTYKIKIGDITYTSKTKVIKKEQKWLLENPAVAVPKKLLIAATDEDSKNLLRFDDQDIPNDDILYFFPGAITVSLKNENNKYLKLKTQSVTLPPDNPPSSFPPITINLVMGSAPDGRYKITRQYYLPPIIRGFVFSAVLKRCVASNRTFPQGCPSYNLPAGKYQDFHVKWFQPLEWVAHKNTITYTYNNPDKTYNASVRFEGPITVYWIAHGKDSKHTEYRGHYKTQLKGKVIFNSGKPLVILLPPSK